MWRPIEEFKGELWSVMKDARQIDVYEAVKYKGEVPEWATHYMPLEVTIKEGLSIEDIYRWAVAIIEDIQDPRFADLLASDEAWLAGVIDYERRKRSGKQQEFVPA